MSTDFSTWGNFRRRLEEAVQYRLRNSKSDGLARVSVVLYMDAAGGLKGWEEPDCKRLEPSRINWCDELGGG